MLQHLLPVISSNQLARYASAKQFTSVSWIAFTSGLLLLLLIGVGVLSPLHHTEHVEGQCHWYQ
jgi:hypothetical protein